MTYKILFVHAGAEMYGADRILLELVLGLRQRGHRCDVVLPGAGELEQAFLAQGVAVTRKNLGVLRRKYFTVPGLLNRGNRLISAVRLLMRKILDEQVDIVHSNTTAVLAGAIAARLTGRCHVWHVHEITTKPRWFAKGMARLVGALSHRVVFVSEATRVHMVGLNPKLAAISVVVHNGIDASRALAGQRGTLRAELGWTESTPVVGMIGRINWWKGQLALVDCVERLVPDLPDLRFLLVGGVFTGEENLREALLARIAQAGLSDHVKVQDFRADVGNVLADLDVFVLPSTEPDPFPTVVLEAMVAERAVVAFRHGGVCEMVEDGRSGLLCSPLDIEAMCHAIRRLIKDPALRLEMGRRAGQRFASHFTPTAFLDQFESVYRAAHQGAT